VVSAAVPADGVSGAQAASGVSTSGEAGPQGVIGQRHNAACRSVAPMLGSSAEMSVAAVFDGGGTHTL